MQIANSDRRMVFAGAEKMPQGSTVTKSHMMTDKKTLGELAEVKSIELPMRQLTLPEED